MTKPTPLATQPAKTARPIALLVTWALLLGVFAVIAPILQEVSGVSFDALAFIMLAPAAASLIVLVRPKWFPSTWKATSVKPVLIASSIALLAVATYAVILSLSLQRLPTVSLLGAGAPLGLFLILQLIGVASEELGWRGVVQQTGEKLGKPWVVSAIAGFLFGATHLGYWQLGFSPVFIFALAAMFMSLTITTIFRGSFWQRLVPAIIVHFGVNMTIASLAQPEDPLATTLTALCASVGMFAVAFILNASLRRKASTTT